MRYRINGAKILFEVVSLISTILIFTLYDGEMGYNLLPLLPFSFFVMSLFSGNMLTKCIPGNYGVTVFLFLLFIRTSIFPVFFTLGRYSDVFGVNIAPYMPSAIWLSVYEVCMVFITFNLCTHNAKRTEKRIQSKEDVLQYNLRAMRFWVFALLAVYVATFVLVPECKHFYQNITDITEVEFTNNEMSTVIDQYATSFLNKLILVLHNYLTKIVRFIVPLHVICEIYDKNKRGSGYFFSIIVSLINVFIIDGTIARGLVYAFVLLLLTCIIYKKEKNIYKVAIVTTATVVVYFYVRAVYAVGMNQNIWEYLSSYIGSYFSSVANTAANIRMTLKPKEISQYFWYDFLESIPFGNTLFGLESISYQRAFNEWSHSAGQIPTTIGTGYVYFGAVLAPVYSVIFAKVCHKSGAVANAANSVVKKGIYLLLATYCALAITMYYTKIVLVVIIGAIIPMILINKLAERRR